MGEVASSRFSAQLGKVATTNGTERAGELRRQGNEVTRHVADAVRSSSLVEKTRFHANHFKSLCLGPQRRSDFSEILVTLTQDQP